MDQELARKQREEKEKEDLIRKFPCYPAPCTYCSHAWVFHTTFNEKHKKYEYTRCTVKKCDCENYLKK